MSNKEANNRKIDANALFLGNYNYCHEHHHPRSPSLYRRGPKRDSYPLTHIVHRVIKDANTVLEGAPEAYKNWIEILRWTQYNYLVRDD